MRMISPPKTLQINDVALTTTAIARCRRPQGVETSRATADSVIGAAFVFGEHIKITRRAVRCQRRLLSAGACLMPRILRQRSATYFCAGLRERSFCH